MEKRFFKTMETTARPAVAPSLVQLRQPPLQLSQIRFPVSAIG